MELQVRAEGEQRAHDAYTVSVATDLLDDGMGLLPECSCRGDRATTNTIVQWLWGGTHAPITGALFAYVINRAVEDQRHGGAIEPILEVAVA